MNLRGDPTTDLRLRSFFDAPSEEEALEAFHRLWESTLAVRMRAYLQSQQIPSAVRSDIEVETYIRVCNGLLLRREEAKEPLNTPQPTTSSLVIITDIQGFTLAVSRRLLYSYFLAQNPAWKSLQRKVISHLKQDKP